MVFVSGQSTVKVGNTNIALPLAYDQIAKDAMVTDRPYRSRRPVADAVEILKLGAGAQWDPALVDLFVREMPTIRQLGAA